MNLSGRQRYGLAIILIGLAFGLRLYQLDLQSIWWDEGHSIFVASQPVRQIPTLPAMDVHPPAYFALLHGWMALAGRSEFALRYLSVGFSLLIVPLVGRFTRLNSPPGAITPLVALFLATLSPMHVAYAQEVRSYTMVTGLALASTLVLWRLLFPGHQRDTARSRSGWLLLYVLLAAASLYTHYFTLFLLLFHNLVWLAWLGRGKFSRGRPPRTLLLHAGLWAASQVGILLLFLPQLLLAVRQISTYTNPNLVPPSLTDFISRSWQAYTVGLTLDPAPARWGMGLVATLLLGGWGIRWLQPLPSRQKGWFLFLVGWLLIPLAAYFAVLQRQPSFEPRYLMLVTPALLLLLAFGLTPLSGGKRHRVFYLFRFMLYGIFLFGLYNYYTNTTYFKDDSAGVAAWLARETTAEDVVLVDVPHPFHYYAEQRQIPAPVHYLFVDIHTAAERLGEMAQGRKRLFWLTWWGSDTDPRGVIPFLAEKAGELGGQSDFKGYHLAWFDLPETAQFNLPLTLEPVEATFGEVLRLDGAAFSPTASSDEPAWVTLHFSLLRETEVNYKVSVRLRGGEGQVVAQQDRELLNDRHFRTSAWPINDPALNQALNVYLLPLAPEIPPGDYQLEVVVYQAEPPYPSEGVTGRNSLEGVAARLGEVRVGP